MPIHRTNIKGDFEFLLLVCLLVDIEYIFRVIPVTMIDLGRVSNRIDIPLG